MCRKPLHVSDTGAVELSLTTLIVFSFHYPGAGALVACVARAVVPQYSTVDVP